MNVKQKQNFLRTVRTYSLFTALIVTALLPMSCGEDDGGTDPTEVANVRLLKVDALNNEVTLKNFGTESADISGYWFCLKRDYSALEEASTDAGDLTLDPNEEITFELSVDDEASDVAIYNTEGSFASASAMVDFMQFGASFAGNAGREDVAASKGIWTAGDFIEAAQEFSYTGDGSTTGASTWDGDSQPVENPMVRIVSVDPANDKVVLKNFGGSQDISGYFFCRRKSYLGLANLTPTTGDLILDQNEEVEFTLTIEDASSDFALYNTGGEFTSATAIVDFMMFGEDINDDGRESVAVAASIWTEDEFVSGDGPYTFTGEADDNGAQFWEGTVTPSITYNVTNSGATAYVFNGGDFTDTSNPGLTFKRGETYIFEVNAPGHPFLINSVQGTGTSNTYNEGVTNNGAVSGTITFTVPTSAPDQLFYNCEFHGSMTGVITITD